MQPFRPLPSWEFKDYLGWMEQGDGKLAYGIYVQVRSRGEESAASFVANALGLLSCSPPCIFDSAE